MRAIKDFGFMLIGLALLPVFCLVVVLGFLEMLGRWCVKALADRTEG